MPTDVLTDRRAALLHLDAALGLAESRAHFYLWTAPDEITHWYTSDEMETAADTATALTEAGQNVYLSLAVAHRRGGATERIKANATAGITGLVIDFDLKDDAAHKRPDLPPDVEAVRGLLGEVLITPTLVIHTGHGIQAWWLFKEPWMFDTDAERQEAMVLARRWGRTWQVKARAHGWHIDSTHDLARVFRLAGTINRKPGCALAPVEILKHRPECRYSTEDFEPYLIGDDTNHGYHGGADRQRADDADFPPADLARIADGCAWLRSCRDNAKTLDEPNWYAMLSITGRCHNGVEWSHTYSRPYPGYTYQDTTDKLTRAMNGTGPRTCEYIRRDLGNEQSCGACPHYARGSSPITLGRPEPTFTFDQNGRDNADEHPHNPHNSMNGADDAHSGYSGDGSPRSGEEPEPWETPAPLGVTTAPAFPVEALPDWLAAMVAAEAEATQTPADLAGVLALAVVAAAVGGKVEVEPRLGWREPLALYVLAVLASGSRKTAVFRDMMAPIYDYERELIEAKRPEVAAERNSYEIKKQALERAQATAAKATGDDRLMAEGDADTLARELAQMTIPALPRLLVDDATPEKLTSILAEQGGRLACLSAEGDLFDIIAGRYSNGAPNLGTILKAHAGDPITVDRTGRPSEHIDRPALTVGLTVQPEVLAGLTQKPGFRGRGLLARFLYSVPATIVGYRRTDAPPVLVEIASNYTDRLRSLLKIVLGRAIDGRPAPHVLGLNPAASTAFDHFHAALEPRLGEFGDLGHIADWGSKLIGAVARLAGLLHLAAHAGHPAPWEQRVSVATMTAAITLGDYFLCHALIGFDSMGADPDVEDARAVLRWLGQRTEQEVTKRDIYQATKGRFKRVEQVEPAIELLIQHGYLRPRQIEARPGPGRKPSPIYEINPAVTHPHTTQNVRPGAL